MRSTTAKTVLTRVLVGVAAFGASTAVGWAITGAVTDEETPPQRSESVAEASPAPPLAERLPEGFVAGDLPGASTTPSEDVEGSEPESPAEGLELQASPIAPIEATVTLSATQSALAEVPATGVISGSDAAEPDPEAEPEDEEPTTTTRRRWADVVFRFIDPCADAPSGCAALAGRTAIGATIMPVDEDAPPLEIRGIWSSGGTSEGCAERPVPDGRRAIGVDLNRPASLRLTWSRGGVQVGEVTDVPLDDAGRERFADDPGRGWSACVDTPFPTAPDAAPALLEVTATADDSTTATVRQLVLDDDARRLLVAIVDDDEIVAMTPDVGEVTLAGIKLRGDENEVAGCRRAAEHVLADRPAPGTEGFLGRPIDEELARRFVPEGGRWVAAHFNGLRESERYAVCLFSVGRARGDTGGTVEATDAVLVQPPDRERYRVRPMTLIAPGSIDGDLVEVELADGSEDGVACRAGWGIVAATRTSAEQDLGSTRWCEFGDIEDAEAMVARVTLDGRTSEATVTFPAHCVGTTTCDPPGAARLVRLEVPGPRYTRRLCGSGAGSCDGLRPRDEVIGTVILLIERVESPVGFEGWTVGGSNRFSAEIPEDYYQLIDYPATRLELGPDGVVTAIVKTAVPSTVTVSPLPCDGHSDAGTPVTSSAPATEHRLELPTRLPPGGCVWASVGASDPTGRRGVDYTETASVRRADASGRVAVEMAVVSLPDGRFPVRGGFKASVGTGYPGARVVWECIGGPGSVATVDAGGGPVALGATTHLTFHVDWLGGCEGSTRLPANRVIEANIDFATLAAGPAIIDHTEPDGTHLRFRVTATDIVLPR